MSRSRRVRFGQAATADLDETWDYIRRESGITRADAVIARVVAGCGRLEQAPSLGRAVPTLGAGVRMLLVEGFEVVYRLTGDDRVEIVRIVDGRRDFPKAWRERDPTAHS